MKYLLVMAVTAGWLLSTNGSAGPGEGHGGGPSLSELFAEAKAEIPGVIAAMDRSDLAKLSEAVKAVSFRWMKASEVAARCLTVENEGKQVAVSNEKCRPEISSPDAAVKELARALASHLRMKGPDEIAEAIRKAYVTGANPFGGEAIKACSKARFPHAPFRLYCLKIAARRNYTAQAPLDLCNRHALASQILECLAAAGNAKFEPRRVDACASKSREPLKDNAAASEALDCLAEARLAGQLVSELHFFEGTGDSTLDLRARLDRVAKDTCTRRQMNVGDVQVINCSAEDDVWTCMGRFVCGK